MKKWQILVINILGQTITHVDGVEATEYFGPHRKHGDVGGVPSLPVGLMLLGKEGWEIAGATPIGGSDSQREPVSSLIFLKRPIPGSD